MADVYEPTKPIVFTDEEKDRRAHGNEGDDVMGGKSANADASLHTAIISDPPRKKDLKVMVQAPIAPTPPSITRQVQEILYGGNPTPGSSWEERRRRKLNQKRRIILEANTDITIQDSTTDWTLDEVFSPDGLDGQTAHNLANYQGATKRISALAWSNDGYYLTIASNADDELITLEGTRPFDPSSIPASGAQVGSALSRVNPSSFGWSDDGLSLWVMANNAADHIYIYKEVFTDPYIVNSASPTSEIGKTDTQISLGGSTDGPAYITLDGTRLYWYRQNSGANNSHIIRTCEMTTPWDFTTLQNWDSEITRGNLPGSLTGNISDAIIVNNAGTRLLYLKANGAASYVGYMSTPHDLTTMANNFQDGAPDETTFDDIDGTADADGGFLDSEGNLWRWITDTSMVIARYVPV